MNLFLYNFLHSDLYSTYKKDNKPSKKDYFCSISIPKRMKVNRKSIETLYEKYIKNISLTEKEKIYLFQIIISNVEFDKEMKEKAEVIYTKILNSDKQASFSEIVLFIQYTTILWLKKHKYDEQGNLKEAYKDLKLPDLSLAKGKKFDCFNSGAMAFSDRTQVCFKGVKLNLMNLAHVCFHELKHYLQYYEMDKTLPTKSALNMIKYFILKDSYEKGYMNNYDFIEIELEAELSAYIETEELLKKFSNNKHDKFEGNISASEKLRDSQAFSYQVDKDKNIRETSEFNVFLFSEYVKNNINILDKNEYKILKLFYNKDGNLKNEEELLKSYKELKKHNNSDVSIFDDFFSVLYSDEKCIYNNNLSDDLLSEKYEIIYNLYSNELNKFRSCARFLIEYGKINMRRIFKREESYYFYYNSLKRLNFYFAFLENNKKINIEADIIEINKITKEVSLSEEVYKILKNDLSLQDYEKIKEKSKNGDEVSKKIEEIITKELEKFKKSIIGNNVKIIYSRNNLLRELQKLIVKNIKNEETNEIANKDNDDSNNSQINNLDTPVTKFVDSAVKKDKRK